MITQRRIRNAAIGVAAVAGLLAPAAGPSAAGRGTPAGSGQVAADGVPIGWYRIQSLALPGQCLQANPSTADNPSLHTRVFCDWRPTLNATQTASGFPVYLEKTTGGGSTREWLLEPVG